MRQNPTNTARAVVAALGDAPAGTFAQRNDAVRRTRRSLRGTAPSADLSGGASTIADHQSEYARHRHDLLSEINSTPAAKAMVRDPHLPEALKMAEARARKKGRPSNGRDLAKAFKRLHRGA